MEVTGGLPQKRCQLNENSGDSINPDQLKWCTFGDSRLPPPLLKWRNDLSFEPLCEISVEISTIQERVIRHFEAQRPR
jgi:hypothetical protein